MVLFRMIDYPSHKLWRNVLFRMTDYPSHELRNNAVLHRIKNIVRRFRITYVCTWQFKQILHHFLFLLFYWSKFILMCL